MLFNQFLIQGFALVQRGLTGLQNSSAHPAHQFDYFLERNDCALVLLDDFFLLSLHVSVDFDDFGNFLMMVEDLIIDEEFIVLLALFGDDAPVVLEEFVVVVLAQLEVLQDHCPVVVEVGFYLPRITQVHPLIKYIISTTQSLQARKHADYTPIIPSKDLISLNLPQTHQTAPKHYEHSFNPLLGIFHKPYLFRLIYAILCPHSYPPSFKINNSNQLHYMKTSKPKQVKTESSLDKGDDDQGRSIGRVSHSNYKKRRVAFTPIRFADIVVAKKSEEKDSRSTNDRDKSNISQPRDQQPMKNSIMQAINIFKEFSGSNTKGEDRDENRKITPFELVPAEEDIFEEQLSFKGASNRISLLRKIDQIELQTGKIVDIIKSLNYNSNLDFITQKLVKQSSKKSKNMKLSFFEFYSHLETSTKRVNDFAIELDRCRQIMLKITTGISCSTMTFYTTKFETLICEMESNVKYLQNYIELLHNIHRQEARQPNRRFALAALHAK